MRGRSGDSVHGIGEAGQGAGAGRLARLAKAVRDRDVSAVDLVERSLIRIEAARDLNAVVLARADDALAEAAVVDEAVVQGRDPGPLAGLPLLVKDIEDVAGVR